MSRRILLVAALLLAGGSARADIPAGAGKLNFELRIPDPNTPANQPITSWIPPSSTQALAYFNLAHCLCSAQAPGSHVADFAIRVTVTGATRPTPLMSHKVELWAGDNCSDLTTRNMNCRPITPTS